MAENEVKTIPEQISAYLSEALMSSNKAKGMVLMIAREDGSITTSMAGDFVTKIGLLAATRERLRDLWDISDSTEDDDD